MVCIDLKIGFVVDNFTGHNVGDVGIMITNFLLIEVEVRLDQCLMKITLS